VLPRWRSACCSARARPRKRSHDGHAAPIALSRCRAANQMHGLCARPLSVAADVSGVRAFAMALRRRRAERLACRVRKLREDARTWTPPQTRATSAPRGTLMCPCALLQHLEAQRHRSPCGACINDTTAKGRHETVATAASCIDTPTIPLSA
jgi:hypothetical protein